MTKLTTERLEQFIANPLGNSLYRTEQMDMARQLLAYEQAAKNPVAYRNKFTGQFFTLEQQPDAVTDTDVYEPVFLAAPVLPKQPELLSIGELLHRLEEQTGEKWIEESAQPVPMEFDAAWENTGHLFVDNKQYAALFYGLGYKAAPAQPVSEPYKLPFGYALVPCKLTAENGAKSCMIGEFTEQTEITCPECFGDDECETCDGSGMIEVTVPVSWTTIKDIWAKGIEHFAVAPAQESE